MYVCMYVWYERVHQINQLGKFLVCTLFCLTNRRLFQCRSELLLLRRVPQTSRRVAVFQTRRTSPRVCTSGRLVQVRPTVWFCGNFFELSNKIWTELSVSWFVWTVQHIVFVSSFCLCKLRAMKWYKWILKQKSIVVLWNNKSLKQRCNSTTCSVLLL